MKTPCIEWTGRKDKDGYGVRGGGLKYRYRDRRVHRLAWEEAHGDIPAGLYVLHRCDNRACHNIEHLFLGTQADNMADKVAKGRQGSRTPAGENARTKLTLAQVERIRGDTRKVRVIAAEYGVSDNAIYAIRNGRAWRYGNGHVRNGVFEPSQESLA